MSKSTLCFKKIGGCIIFSLLFSLFFKPAFAQEILHNLENQYRNLAPTDTNRLQITNKYVTALYSHKQEKKAFQILEENIQIALKVENAKYVANLYAVAAMTYRLSELKDKSSENLDKAIQYANQAKDNEVKGYVSYVNGWLLSRDQHEGEAISYFIKALNTLESAPPSPTLNAKKSSIYKEMAAIYANWKEYNLQEKYGLLALEFATKQSDPLPIFDAYMVMGYMYEQQYYIDQSNQQKRDRAEKYYLQAIQTYERNKENIAFPSTLSFVANNLSYLYLSFYPDSYLKRAHYYAELAKAQATKTKQNTQIASSLGIMSEIALRNNDTRLAKQYLLTALAEVSKSSITDQNIVLSIYESLSNISEDEGNLTDALKYNKGYIETYKSIFDQEQLALGKRLEAQFDKERQSQQLINMQLLAAKKEQEIDLLNTISIQHRQEFENLKLQEENQRKQLAVTVLESEKNAQELKLSKLESESRSQDIVNYKKEISFKEKINKYYSSLIAVFVLLIILLLYAYRQRSTRLKQNKTLYNITLEKERQKSKISNLTAMLEGQEIERGRMARDLHDGLGGLLSSTKISLSMINGDTQKELQKPISQIDTAVEELRKIAHNLMPDLLHKFGIREALLDYAVRMSTEILDINVQFLHYTNQLNKETQLLVYRIVQELVNNAVKHAKPSQIIIQFVEEMDNYSITVEDDGTGFDVESVKESNSAGLINIQTRVDFLKGNFHIHSERQIGTSIEITFPKPNTP